MANKKTELNEILTYFENKEIHLPIKLAENINIFISTIELLKGYPRYFDRILKDKILPFKQLEGFLQYFNEIKAFYQDLETMYRKNVENFLIISNIANEVSELVVKLPYIAELRTSGVQFRGKKKAHFYMVNHEKLIEFLNDIKSFAKPVDIDNIKHSTISDKFKEILDTLPSIKLDYSPNVVYSKVPESFEQIILLGKDLKDLFDPISYLEKYEFFKELIEKLSNDFVKIKNYFNMNPESDFIKLKGKFRKVNTNLNTLYRALSFYHYIYY